MGPFGYQVVMDDGTRPVFEMRQIIAAVRANRAQLEVKAARCRRRRLHSLLEWRWRDGLTTGPAVHDITGSS